MRWEFSALDELDRYLYHGEECSDMTPVSKVHSDRDIGLKTNIFVVVWDF